MPREFARGQIFFGAGLRRAERQATEADRETAVDGLGGPSRPAQKRSMWPAAADAEFVPVLETVFPTDPVSVEVVTEQLRRGTDKKPAPHRPRVGGSHDWAARTRLAGQSRLPPTRGRWGARACRGRVLAGQSRLPPTRSRRGARACRGRELAGQSWLPPTRGRWGVRVQVQGESTERFLHKNTLIDRPNFAAFAQARPTLQFPAFST